MIFLVTFHLPFKRFVVFSSFLRFASSFLLLGHSVFSPLTAGVLDVFSSMISIGILTLSRGLGCPVQSFGNSDRVHGGGGLFGDREEKFRYHCHLSASYSYHRYFYPWVWEFGYRFLRCDLSHRSMVRLGCVEGMEDTSITMLRREPGDCAGCVKAHCARRLMRR